MTMGYLTSQNSTAQISIEGLPPFALENFATDKMFGVEPSKPTVGSKSADGKFSAAALPQTFPLTVTLRANSSSIPYINQWNEMIKQGREVVPCNYLQVDAPSLGGSVTYTVGTLEEFTAFPDANGQYDEISFKIHFADAQTTYYQ